MTKEQSFLAKLGDLTKKNELLRLPYEKKIQVKVGTIIALCTNFHSAGYEDGKNDLSIFESVFGKGRK